jgi:hypothetical protein
MTGSPDIQNGRILSGQPSYSFIYVYHQQWMQVNGQFYDLVALAVETLCLGYQQQSNGWMKPMPQHILYRHVWDVIGHPEHPVHIPSLHQYMTWHWPLKIFEWSQMLSLAFKLVFLWSVSMCHKAQNHLMIEKVLAARIFLSFKRLIQATEHINTV